jgi:hypothetical protein
MIFSDPISTSMPWRRCCLSHIAVPVTQVRLFAVIGNCINLATTVLRVGNLRNALIRDEDARAWIEGIPNSRLRTEKDEIVALGRNFISKRTASLSIL